MRSELLTLVDESRLAGIAFAFRFNSSGHAVRVADTTDIGLDDRAAFWWVNVNLADQRGQAWIQSCERLSPRAKRLLLGAETSDRVEADEGVLAGVMGDAEVALAETTDRVSDLRFAVGENFLVTGRKHPLHALQALRLDLESEPGLHVYSASDLFAALIEKDVDRITASARELAKAVEKIEDDLLIGSRRDLHKQTIEARRTAVRLHRQVLRVRGPFRSARLSAHQQLPATLYGVADRVTQMLDVMHEDVHSLHERARLAQEELAARLSTSTNQQLYLLSILTAAFLPPTLVTGLFGMNVGGVPFKDDDNGFLWSIALCVGSALIVLVGLAAAFRLMSSASSRRP